MRSHLICHQYLVLGEIANQALVGVLATIVKLPMRSQLAKVNRIFSLTHPSNSLAKFLSSRAMAECRRMWSSEKTRLKASCLQVESNRPTTCQTLATSSIRMPTRAGVQATRTRLAPTVGFSFSILSRWTVRQQTLRKLVRLLTLITNGSLLTLTTMSRFRIVRFSRRELLMPCSKVGYLQESITTRQLVMRTHALVESHTLWVVTLSAETKSNHWTWAITEATSVPYKGTLRSMKTTLWPRQASTWTVWFDRICLRRMESRTCTSTLCPSNSTKSRSLPIRRNDKKQDSRRRQLLLTNQVVLARLAKVVHAWSFQKFQST